MAILFSNEIMDAVAIIKRMRDQITESISTYHFNLDMEAKQDFAFSIITDSLDRKKYSDASNKDKEFESLIIEKAELWEDYFQKYLYSCIEKMKLNKIEMPEGSRARAIDIYENMNMGGLRCVITQSRFRCHMTLIH